MKKKINIGALISGTGTNLEAIIKACEKNKINGKVIFVGSDNPKAKGLEKAAKHDIPTFFVDYGQIIKQIKNAPTAIKVPEDFDFDEIWAKQKFFLGKTADEKQRFFIISRVIAESELLKIISAYSFDLIILAGFMRKLTPYFINHINTDLNEPRIMNIHPALLPSFPGTDGYGDTFRYGCKVGGCTVHFVDYGEDSGEIIGQKAFPILAHDTLDSVKQKGLELEWELYEECIQLFAQSRLPNNTK